MLPDSSRLKRWIPGGEERPGSRISKFVIADLGGTWESLVCRMLWKWGPVTWVMGTSRMLAETEVCYSLEVSDGRFVGRGEGGLAM